MLIGIVGPCSAGKSTLAFALRDLGFRVKEIMQEHCSAPDMWRRLTNPDVLIYLDVSEKVAAQREGLSKPSSWWQEERQIRLAHARKHCDIYVDTSTLAPAEVFESVISKIQVLNQS
jgi:chloramphenicol 3-O-phosphotransferase